MLCDTEVEPLAQCSRICRKRRFIPLRVEISVSRVEEKHGTMGMKDNPQPTMMFCELLRQGKSYRTIALTLAGRIDGKQPESHFFAVQKINPDHPDQGAVAKQTERMVLCLLLIRMIRPVFHFRQVTFKDRPLAD